MKKRFVLFLCLVLCVCLCSVGCKKKDKVEQPADVTAVPTQPEYEDIAFDTFVSEMKTSLRIKADSVAKEETSLVDAQATTTKGINVVDAMTKDALNTRYGVQFALKGSVESAGMAISADVSVPIEVVVNEKLNLMKGNAKYNITYKDKEKGTTVTFDSLEGAGDEFLVYNDTADDVTYFKLKTNLLNLLGTDMFTSDQWYKVSGLGDLFGMVESTDVFTLDEDDTEVTDSAADKFLEEHTTIRKNNKTGDIEVAISFKIADFINATEADKTAEDAKSGIYSEFPFLDGMSGGSESADISKMLGNSEMAVKITLSPDYKAKYLSFEVTGVNSDTDGIKINLDKFAFTFDTCEAETISLPDDAKTNAVELPNYLKSAVGMRDGFKGDTDIDGLGDWDFGDDDFWSDFDDSDDDFFSGSSTSDTGFNPYSYLYSMYPDEVGTFMVDDFSVEAPKREGIIYDNSFDFFLPALKMDEEGKPDYYVSYENSWVDAEYDGEMLLSVLNDYMFDDKLTSEDLKYDEKHKVYYCIYDQDFDTITYRSVYIFQNIGAPYYITIELTPYEEWGSSYNISNLLKDVLLPAG